MAAIDLITGFLGAGKTTFLREYVTWLMQEGMNVCILENDYGAINTDVMLLQDLRGDHCEIEMIVGGDGYEAHRRRLRTKLISMAMMGYDRVVMEPSGIFDADELMDLLHEEPLDRWYKLENIIAIVDATAAISAPVDAANHAGAEADAGTTANAGAEANAGTTVNAGEKVHTPAHRAVTDETAWLMVSQTANAGKIVMSKTQLTTPEKCAEHIQALNSMMQTCGCGRRFSERDVIMKEWDYLTKEDREAILHAGHANYDFIHLQTARENEYDSLFYFRVRMTPEQVEEAAKKCLQDRMCGNVIRVKGCFKDGEMGGYLINATKEHCEITPCDAGQEVIIVIGEKLCKERIDGNWVWDGLTF